MLGSDSRAKITIQAETCTVTDPFFKETMTIMMSLTSAIVRRRRRMMMRRRFILTRDLGLNHQRTLIIFKL